MMKSILMGAVSLCYRVTTSWAFVLLRALASQVFGSTRTPRNASAIA